LQAAVERRMGPAVWNVHEAAIAHAMGVGVGVIEEFALVDDRRNWRALTPTVADEEPCNIGITERDCRI
jgi:hypothetical protein